MTTFAAASAALLLALALAGCGDDDDGNGGTATPTTASPATPTGATPPTQPTGATPTSPTSPTGGPSPGNEAPTVTLTANATSGTAPLVVNFTIDASDPDGDAMTFALDVDGDGLADAEGSAPGTAEWTFETAGDYNVTATVSDGDRSANATVSISVTVSETLPPGPDPACERPTAVEAGGMYLDDRGPSGGTWVYEETNDLEGLQLNDNDSLAGEKDSLAIANGCTGGDTLIF